MKETTAADQQQQVGISPTRYEERGTDHSRPQCPTMNFAMLRDLGTCLEERGRQ
jgi:hypothetical protein